MADEFSHSRLGRRVAVCHAQMLALPGMLDYKDKDAEVTQSRRMPERIKSKLMEKYH